MFGPIRKKSQFFYISMKSSTLIATNKILTGTATLAFSDWLTVENYRAVGNGNRNGFRQ